MTQLYDQFGRLLPRLLRPETREIAAPAIRDRWSGYPSRGLTPQRLAAIFAAADAGELRAQAELFEEMEEKDPHLMSVMQTRRLAVLGLEWQVTPASEATADKKAADFCREVLQAAGIENLLRHLLGAVGHGYAAAEIRWQTGRQALIGGWNFIHPKNITFVNTLTPRVITADHPEGVEPAPWQLVYHRHPAKSGHDTRNGVLRVCGYMYLLKNYALKEWAAFNEIFGMPLRLGKYDPSATPADREALRQAIVNLGSDAAGIISKSTEIEFIEASQRLSGTTNPYEVLASFCNREMSKAVLGQTLTTDTQGSTGTYAAGAVQAEVRRDILEADALYLAATVRDQVLRPLVGFNFGWDRPTPVFDLIVEEGADLKADADMVARLVEAGAGARIPAAWINDHFGIPQPREGEDTLSGLGGGPNGDSRGSRQGAAARTADTAMKAVLPLANGELELLPQDRQVVQTQKELEALVQEALAAAEAAADRMLAPVRHLIENGKTLEDVRQELIALYGEMPAEDLAEMLYRARMVAWMRGRDGDA